MFAVLCCAKSRIDAKDGARRTKNYHIVLDRPTWFFERLQKYGCHHSLGAGKVEVNKRGAQVPVLSFEPSMVLHVKFDRQFEGRVCIACGDSAQRDCSDQ